MSNIIFDTLDPFDDQARRRLVFAGDIVVDSPTPGGAGLCQLAQSMLQETFPEGHPQTAQFRMEVEDFVERLGPLKSRFTNAEETKALVQELLAERGCDLERTYFDVPRLRAATHGGYLTAGVGYAYKAHRDTWYASPHSQLNWWLPIYTITAEQALVFYPSYWSRPVENSSAGFDYDEWVGVGRQMASDQIKSDTRRHPLPEEGLDPGSEMRLTCRGATSICFSSAHLHGTAPNTSGATRYSLDFRTVNIDDLAANTGAPNVDSESRGTTLADFLRASDFTHLPPELTGAAPVA